MCPVATILVLLCSFVVYQKFLSQNGRQFRLRYVRGPIDTVGVTCTYSTYLGARHKFGGGSAPHSYVPGHSVEECVDREVLLVCVALLYHVILTVWFYFNYTNTIYCCRRFVSPDMNCSDVYIVQLTDTVNIV